MKFGDKVTIRDGSFLDGSSGIIYQLEEGQAVVLLDKEVLWPVAEVDLELLINNE
jgi:hypothetical protein